MNQGTVGERGGDFNNSSFLFSPTYRHLDISRVITAENSPLHIASSRTQTENPCFRTQVTNHYVTCPQIKDLFVIEVQKDSGTTKYNMNVMLLLYNVLFPRSSCQLFTEP